MALTYERAFFESLGFQMCDRSELPLKVWSECVRCLKHHSCDEIAMVRQLDGVAEIKAPRPEGPPDHAYVVPVTLKVVRPGPRPPMDQTPRGGSS
jgi:hypothetical protein